MSLAIAYALGRPMPYLAPIFAFFLGVKPAPPMPFKGLVGLALLVSVTCGLGLLVVPMLVHAPAAAILVVALGLYTANDMSLNRGKAIVGTFLTVGLTLISAAGASSPEVGHLVVDELVMAICIAVVVQWSVYFWLPEDPPVAGSAPPPAAGQGAGSAWLAARTTLIVLPAYLMALHDPGTYLAIIMKSVSLGQQSTLLRARGAGTELLVSTFVGGILAMVVWFALKLNPSLLMFFLWTLLAGLYCVSRIYGITGSRYPPGVWSNAFVTFFILIGPAVQDSVAGEDVYRAFVTRMGLFLGVTVYAWAAIVVLDQWRSRLDRRGVIGKSAVEAV